jgi:hypothetical protein
LVLAALDAANVGNDPQLRDLVLTSLGTFHEDQNTCPDHVAAYKWRLVCSKIGSHTDDISEGNVCERVQLSSRSHAIRRNHAPLPSELEKEKTVGLIFCLRSERIAAICENVIDRGHVSDA